MAIISAQKLTKVYKASTFEVTALAGVDLSVKEGEMIAIMGPSGCGKTTLLNCLSSIDSVTSGTIQINNTELSSMSDDDLSEFRAKSMGFIFQTYNLLPVLNAQENVELPLLVSGTPSSKAKRAAREALDLVGLIDWANHKPAELSGGQQQRVTVARALVNKPAIVWADEPTGNLDSGTEKEIMDLLCRLNEENNQTFVVVTHSDYVGGRTQKIIKMKDGLIL